MKYDSYLRLLTPALLILGSFGIVTHLQAMEEDEKFSVRAQKEKLQTEQKELETQLTEAKKKLADHELHLKLLNVELTVNENIRDKQNVENAVQKERSQAELTELKDRLEVAKNELEESDLRQKSILEELAETEKINEEHQRKHQQEYVIQQGKLEAEQKELETQIEVVKSKLEESERHRQFHFDQIDIAEQELNTLTENHVAEITALTQAQEAFELKAAKIQKFCYMNLLKVEEAEINLQKFVEEKEVSFQEMICSQEKETLMLWTNENYTAKNFPKDNEGGEFFSTLLQQLGLQQKKHEEEREKAIEELNNISLKFDEGAAICEFFNSGFSEWKLLSELELDFLFTVQELIDHDTLYNLIIQTIELPKIKRFQYIKDFYERKNEI